MKIDNIPDWGLLGWIQFLVQVGIILFGGFVAISSTSTIGIGLSYMAIGFALAVTQINAYKGLKQFALLEEMKKQLDRIEKKKS